MGECLTNASPEVDAQHHLGPVIPTLSRMVRGPRPSLIIRKSKASPVLRREFEKKRKDLMESLAGSLSGALLCGLFPWSHV